MSGVKKATFQVEGGASFETQYNPKDFSYDKKLVWKEHTLQGKERPLEFQENKPASMSMDLHFDTTHNGSDVREKWVHKLLALTNPSNAPCSGEVSSLEKERPPKVTFSWGNFQMVGVIEQLTVNYVMFSAEGQPLRATVQVKMKEWTPDTYADGTATGADWYGSEATKLVTVKAGQTVTAVALENNVSVRQLCDDNGWDDPLEDVKAGVVAIINKAKKAIDEIDKYAPEIREYAPELLDLAKSTDEGKAVSGMIDGAKKALGKLS
jgi:hypothetical protein